MRAPWQSWSTRRTARRECTGTTRRARALLALGHGAAGSVTAPDLQAAKDAALVRGVSVALVDSPIASRAGARRRPRTSSTPPGWPSWPSWAGSLLVVQGLRDRFGMPPGAVQVPGDHGLKTDVNAVAEAVGEWLDAASFTSRQPEE